MRIIRAKTAGSLLALAALIATLADAYVAHKRHVVEDAILGALRTKDPTIAVERSDLPGLTGMPDHVRGLFGIPAPVIAIAIAGKRISDEDLSAIASLSDLEGLTLDRCAISDVAIGEIARLQRLRALNIFACEGITDSGIARLGRANSLDSWTSRVAILQAKASLPFPRCRA